MNKEGSYSSCGLVPNFEVHRALISDEQTQGKFRRAIRSVVRPGDVVLDLGTGSGIHAVFACQAGAKRVYAIESAVIIELAKGLVKANGYSDRVRFIRGVSHQVKLPEKVDVIINNMGFPNVARNLSDARRFLKKTGKLIPCAIKFSFVPVDYGESYERKISFWDAKHYGLKFDFLRKYAVNQPQPAYFEKDDFLSAPQQLMTIDLSLPLKSYLSFEAIFKMNRGGLVHGLGSWYSFKLSDTIALSPKPPLILQRSIWFHHFFPFSTPVSVKKGDPLKIGASMLLGASSSLDQIWKWSFEIGGRRVTQSNFNSVPFSKEFSTSDRR